MKILIPVDGSQSNDRVLDWAGRFLVKNDVQLCLLHVTLIGFSEYPLYELNHEQGEALMERISLQLQKEGFSIAEKAAITTHDSVAAAICEMADEWRVDQILMGSHGRSGLLNLLMGSVSESVFKHAKQPVLILSSSSNGQASLKASHMDRATVCDAEYKR